MAGEKIVIIEDEGVVALNLQSRLEAANYAVTGVADSAKTAISLVETTIPDLVLMDIRLKGNQTGIDLAQEIRDRWDIPIVFLTGYSDADTLRLVQDADPYGYLIKPFDSTELYSTIGIALQKHQHHQRLEHLVRERTEALGVATAQLNAEVRQRQQLETEVAQAIAKLNELRSRFITTVSHEFRTPLSIVLTSAELLERLGADCPEERRSRYFQKIRDAVRSMTAILTNALTVGKAESGVLKFNPTSFDLHRFCLSLISDLQFGSPALIQLSYVGEVQVTLDPELLTLILTNLLSNAIKFSPTDSTIQLEVRSLIGEPTVRLTVSDRGVGIPPDDLPLVFEPFHRGTNVDTISGGGLGLAIVRHCVALHRGTLQIESQLGQGTTAIVELPSGDL